MYRPLDKTQPSLLDFNQPIGLKMNPKNRWVQLADSIPWDELEKNYASLFPSSIGNVAKPLRMALGSLIIQKKFQFSDRELVAQITENPYLQYFIGLPGYQDEPPFDASTLVLFRKRLDVDAIIAANAFILDEHNHRNATPPASTPGQPSTPGNAEPVSKDNNGTLIIDATCAPVNIRYPQDISLLNEAREKLERILQRFHEAYGLPLPRRYTKRARKDYLAYAKAKKHSKKQTRNAIKKQLSYVRRDLSYLESFMSEGYALGKGEIPLFLTIRTLYQQQKRMYDNKVHSVADRIVSIRQPWVRPIVRGKVKAPAEFGAKLDISLDEKGYVRLERVSFDAYNEGVYLQEAIKRYYARCGHYPKRALVDQIYRTRENRRFCKEHGIRMSGPKLGRPSKKEQSKQEKKQEYQDNTDRIEVEREFSVEKHSYGLGLVTTKLKETQLGSIALSIFAANLFKMQRRILCAFFAIWSETPYWPDRLVVIPF